MNITPVGNIYLLNVPLTADNKNQLDFENEQAQYEYFFSRKVSQFNIEDATYIRKDGIIYLPFHIDDLWNVNYLMYKNSNFSNKWFYAFIIGMEYENDNTTKIKIQTDVFQTWAYNYEILDSFVEREMVASENDIPGLNLLPEGLELGEIKIESDNSSEYYVKPLPVIAYSGTTIPYGVSGSDPRPIKQGGIINGIATTVTFIVCPNMEEFDKLQETLQYDNYSEYILTAFTIPIYAVRDLIKTENRIGTYYVAYSLNNVKYQPPIYENLRALPDNIDGYYPKNKKLLQYPYIYLGFDPKNGSQKIYRYENFNEYKPRFKVISEINPNPTLCFIPQNYRGSTNNTVDMGTINGYPTLATRTDYFNTWMAQNSNIISLNMQQESFNYEIGQIKTGVEGMANIIDSAVKMNVGSAVTGAISTGLNLAQADVNHEFYIKQQMAQIERQKLLPDNVSLGSSNATLLGYDEFVNDIFNIYSIKRNQAIRIDEYFSMYGYLTNEVKKPNLRSRPNWNYVKTVGINIKSGIPQEDIQVLKNIYNNGVTIWHNPVNFGDYSVNNM